MQPDPAARTSDRLGACSDLEPWTPPGPAARRPRLDPRRPRVADGRPAGRREGREHGDDDALGSGELGAAHASGCSVRCERRRRGSAIVARGAAGSPVKPRSPRLSTRQHPLGKPPRGDSFRRRRAADATRDGVGVDARTVLVAASPRTWEIFSRRRAWSTWLAVVVGRRWSRPAPGSCEARRRAPCSTPPGATGQRDLGKRLLDPLHRADRGRWWRDAHTPTFVPQGAGTGSTRRSASAPPPVELAGRPKATTTLRGAVRWGDPPPSSCSPTSATCPRAGVHGRRRAAHGRSPAAGGDRSRRPGHSPGSGATCPRAARTSGARRRSPR